MMSAAHQPRMAPVRISKTNAKAALAPSDGGTINGSSTGINTTPSTKASPRRKRQSNSGTASTGAVRHKPSTRAITIAQTPAWLSTHCQFQSPISGVMNQDTSLTLEQSRDRLDQFHRKRHPAGEQPRQDQKQDQCHCRDAWDEP